MRSAALNRYWNRRMDPLDWTSVRERHDPRRWVRARETFLDPATRHGLELLEPLGDRRVLELGCGLGHGAQELARRGANVVAVDVSERRCAVAREAVQDRVATSFCSADAERLPFPDASFDRIFCRDVLMYADAGAVAGECARLLRPGGRTVFVESLRATAPVRLFRRVTGPGDYRRFTRHLGWDDLQQFPAPLRLLAARPFYLLSAAAFFALFCLRSSRLYRPALTVLEPIDRRLLESAPALARGAWRGTVLYGRENDGV